jgi:protein gp37
MAERSAISWTRSTFNPWLGCTKIGPGCDHCYAEALDKRHRWGGDTHWGDDKPRHRTSASYWHQPLLWNAKQTSMLAGDPSTPPWRVFCASLADVFDNKVPDQWRRDLWDLIEATPNLSWLLVTKRVGNVRGMVPMIWHATGFPSNVRVLITVVNKEEADRDVPKLLALPCKNGVSYEPALGPVYWSPWLDIAWSPILRRWKPLNGMKGNGLQWIIVGGESTQGSGKARPFVHGWARDTVQQCKAAGIPPFVKQMGSNAVNREGIVHPYKDRAGADPAEWPEDLRVQEFPA